PPPVLPPIQQRLPSAWSPTYPPAASHHRRWAAPNSHGSSSESGDKVPGSASRHQAAAPRWPPSATGARPVSASGGAPGGSY
ncbi:hypothetical protein FRB90_004261, partial [Tulasnella sp. 427]